MSAELTAKVWASQLATGGKRSVVLGHQMLGVAHIIAENRPLLGAGKTTLAQGIGSALNVRGRVSSPTFIVARVHPSLAGGPDLVHVDAYRLTSLEDLETLDLDSSLEESITLVEWGEGMVEGISDNRLEIKVERPQGRLAGADASGITDLGGVDDGARTITLTGYGPRWEKALNQL